MFLRGSREPGARSPSCSPRRSQCSRCCSSASVQSRLFTRDRDLADLEKLATVQGAALDAAYVRHWIVDMMGEDDERVAAWDRIVAASRLHDTPPQAL